jgi:hypothetical protein
MAQAKISLHSSRHYYCPNVEIVPINPVYEDRMFVSGFLGFVNTTYKRVLIKHDGYKELWSCGICGNDANHVFHQQQEKPISAWEI